MSFVLGTASAVFWGLLVLSLLVFIHEGGHYGAARAFGMRVTEFFLGMPSPWRLSHKLERYGTEVGVTPILLGLMFNRTGAWRTTSCWLALLPACSARGA